MATVNEAPILELGKNRVPGGSVFSIETGDDELYIATKAGLAQVDRIDADDPDWYQIALDSLSLMRDKTKDIEDATSLGHTLFKRYASAGLAAAPGLLTALTNTFRDYFFTICIIAGEDGGQGPPY